VFLDELENATPAVQRRLLFISESGELRPLGATRNVHVDIRLVTATNIPLRELVAKKLFLPDLAARLSGCPIMLPPLHRRRQDIPLLVGYFIARFARATSYEKDPDFTVPLLSALQAAPWPDNVRGLAFTVRRLMIEAFPATVIGLEHCVDDLAFLRSVGTGTGRPTRAEAEALVREYGSVAAAAQQLGISRATFYRCLSTRGEETPHRRMTD
jgi:DNA-binding NtrC family response regulator